jgi:hypothetical protein
MSLLPACNLGQQWEIVRGELILDVVPYNDHLYFFHVIHLKHLDSTFIHDFK